jgi:hypothetical protein
MLVEESSEMLDVLAPRQSEELQDNIHIFFRVAGVALLAFSFRPFCPLSDVLQQKLGPLALVSGKMAADDR